MTRKEWMLKHSDKVGIRKTMGEPHIKDVFYAIVEYTNQYILLTKAENKKGE